ncbi:MAG: stage IV sporulation protein A [Oscillospiraceae bacterium]|nr:stage IV sporulation protein A [Oscillospiraceae bacterium]
MRDIYNDIACRTDGDIYIGVVGPVRTGKSTFIKRFMETLVIPNIESDFKKERAVDELPQSSGGKTIMTTEPKFIPEDAVEIAVGHNARLNVRMIDCVGYIVPSSLGYIENEMPRMVMTPWFEEEVPFNMAAEVGTQKVIEEHSTIGLVVTTDGSISDIPREEYQEAEERVVNELHDINKPFVMIMNCVDPDKPSIHQMCEELSVKYDTAVMPLNCLELDEAGIRKIIKEILYSFPVKEINIKMPKWITRFEKGHWLKEKVFTSIKDAAAGISHLRDSSMVVDKIKRCSEIVSADITDMDLGKGSLTITAMLDETLFYKILCETTGINIESESDLLPILIDLNNIKRKYDKIAAALDEVEATGYGIVMPDIEELSLEEPKIIKQGGKYGVKLKASAPSIHLMKANITTTVSPIVGSEKQSEELIMYLMQGFEESPTKIWDSNIFGKSLHDLVNEGLHNKLHKMPMEARLKLQETLERVINEGCSGLICFIL